MANKPLKKRILIGLLIVFGVIFLTASIGTFILAKSVFDHDLDFHFKKRSEIFDRNGELVSYIYTENREYVSLEKIPLSLQRAVVAIEDKTFWHHKGINIKSIVRALVVDIREGKKVQGASTITQQLVKNMFLSHDKTWIRKIKEATLALMVESRYTKDEILEYYLNLIYLGPNVYGVQAASEYYFQKPVDKLNVGEASLLAGIVNGPGYYSPYINLENAYKRRQLVLDAMVEEGYLSQEEANKAANQEISTKQPQKNNPPQYYISETLKELASLGFSLEDLQTKGYKIYTALDLSAQRLAEKTVNSALPNAYVDANGLTQPQAAMVVLNVQDSGIMVLVGGRGEDRFNRATMARRQPGSTLKPFVFLAALQKGHTAATLVPDAPLSFNDGWTPGNYDNQFLGDIAMGYALERSRNMAAIRVLADVGVDKVIQLTNSLGISSITKEKDRNLALALGGLTDGVTPLEMAGAYATFPRGGTYIKPYYVSMIKDRRDRIVYSVKLNEKRVISKDDAFMLTDMLRNVVEYGTGKSARLGRPAAGKTGIADNYTNAWFVGFTPEIASAVWIGNDRQSEPMNYGSTVIGSSMSASIFKNFAIEYLKPFPVQDFVMPENIERVSIDVYTGKQTTSDKVLRRYYAFQKDNLPKKDKVGFIDEVTEKLQQFWQRFFGF